MNQISIGERLKQLRNQCNFTQAEVARMIKISKQTLYKYENGIITNIPSDKIEKLADVYHVTPGYIMGWEKQRMIRNDFTNKEKNDIYSIVKK